MADLNNNVYYKLELSVDPCETDWGKLCAQVDKRRLEFNKSDATKPLAQFAQRFLTRYKDGDNTTKAGDAEFPDAFDAKSEEESAREERLKSLKEKIKLDLADGVLEESEYNDTIKRHGKYFKDTTIQKLYGSAYPPFKYQPSGKPKSVSDGEKHIVDPVKMKDIMRLLAQCGKDNLYAFIDVQNIGICQHTPLSAITATIAKAHSFWRSNRKTDPDVAAATKIFDGKYLDLCFGNDEKRAGYDLTLKKEVFKAFIASAGFAKKESIVNTEWQVCLAILQGKGLSEEEANYFLWEFCITTSIKLPRKPISKTDKILCPDPSCLEPNEPSARYCRKCGAPIIVKCPQCNKECCIRDKACQHCGFEISNMSTALRLVKEVRETLAKVSEIGSKIRQINTYWRDAPGAEELRKEWKKINYD